MRILVPSYNRAGQCSTMDMLETAVAVVPESQKDEYESYYPHRVLTVADKSDGWISKKRNAVLDLLEEDELAWMLDDDLIEVIHLKHGKVEDVEELLEVNYNLMKEGGFYFGGFNHSNDPARNLDYNPFSFKKSCYAAVAIRRGTMAYDERLKMFEDIDYFLQVMNTTRRVFVDNRFFFRFAGNMEKKKGGEGGIDYSEKLKEESKKILLKKWGSDIIKIKDGKVNGCNVKIAGA